MTEKMEELIFEQLFKINEELKSCVKKDDLKNFATKDDLKNFATKDDLKNFATKDDLKNFATKEDLKNFATKEIKKLMQNLQNKQSKFPKNLEWLLNLQIESIAKC